jgi:hypothetical protein
MFTFWPNRISKTFVDIMFYGITSWIFAMAANFSYFVQYKNRCFYVKLLLSRTLDFFLAFCGANITVGVQCATLRSCEREFNTTALVNLLICNVNVNIILWRNINIVSMKLFPQSDLDLLRYQRVSYIFFYCPYSFG